MIFIDHNHPKVIEKMREMPGLGLIQAINSVRADMHAASQAPRIYRRERAPV